MACYNDCGPYTVTPMLVAPAQDINCCNDPPMCFPCLPKCPKGMVSCEEKRHALQSNHEYHKCDSHTEDSVCCDTPCKPIKTKYVIPCYRYEDGRINQPTLLMQRACEVATGIRRTQKPTSCPYIVTSNDKKCNALNSLDHSRQVHSKESCHDFKEVVFEMDLCQSMTPINPKFDCPNNRSLPCVPCRRKPYVKSCYTADNQCQIHEYETEDNKGNCCYHFERQYAPKCCNPPKCRSRQFVPCESLPHCSYSDCVYTRDVEAKSPCYFC